MRLSKKQEDAIHLAVEIMGNCIMMGYDADEDGSIDQACETLLKMLPENSYCQKISKGIYEYRGYRLRNCGYNQSDHCIWWEAVNLITDCVAYRANTKKDLIKLIDSYG